MAMESKPLLFIDTVQTPQQGTSGQVSYDSRRPPKDMAEKKKQPHAPKRVTHEKQPSKVRHQANLLDRRAKQEHYVYIQVTNIKGEEVKGYFKALKGQAMEVEGSDGIQAVDLKDVLEIRILKV